MSMEDVKQDAIKVSLDKEREMLFVNRCWRILIARYGTVSASFDALKKITPHKDETGEDAPIAIDDDFYDTYITWLHAALSYSDKDITREVVSDIVDGLSLSEIVGIRVLIWAAIIVSTPKARSDADPTKTTP